MEVAVRRLRSAANVGTMPSMNPYEPLQAQTVNERIPAQRRRKLIVALSLAVWAGLIIGGMVTFFMMRIHVTRVAQAESMRAIQAAEVAELRAREATLKAESEQNSSVP